MKVLLIINIILPFPAQEIGLKSSSQGGWLNSIVNNLAMQSNIELAVATTYNGKELKEIGDGKIKYFLVPGGATFKYNRKQEKYWQIINNKFKPDLTHIHGTEYAHPLVYLNSNKSKVKTIVSIQGLVSRCADVYLSNISEKNARKNITFRNLILHDDMIQRKKDFERRGKIEKQIIKQSDAVIGRTAWDYSNVKAINSNVKYFHCDEILRDSFYNSQWDINNVERHTIFLSQAAYPIKGLHYLLEAVKILKQTYNYNDVKLYIGGKDITYTKDLKSKLLFSNYGRYIKNLIKKFDISENVIFKGMLDEKQMKERFLKSNVFVLPSSIENSSNSLCEAMMLGMPCIASNTGGTMDMIEHKKEGYLYPYTEPALCAKYISDIFEDDKLAIKIGEKSRERAMKRHSKEKIIQDTIDIYNKILNYK